MLCSALSALYSCLSTASFWKHPLLDKGAGVMPCLKNWAGGKGSALGSFALQVPEASLLPTCWV